MPTDDEDLFATEDDEKEKPDARPAGLDITTIRGADDEDVPLNNDVDEPKEKDEDKSRRERRAERGQLRKSLEEKDSALLQLRTELAEVKGYVSGLGQRMQGQGNQVDPIQQAIEQTYDDEDTLRQKAINLAQSGKGTDDERRAIDRQARQLEQRRFELTTRKTMRDSGIGPQDPNATARAVAAARFPDIHGNERAADFMRQTFGREVAAGAAPDDALLERVAAETRERFRLVRRPAPTAADRSRYSGSGGRSAGSSTPEPTSITMNKTMKAIAYQTYAHRSDLNDRQKVELWAKTYGRKLAKAQ